MNLRGLFTISAIASVLLTGVPARADGWMRDAINWAKETINGGCSDVVLTRMHPAIAHSKSCAMPSDSARTMTGISSNWWSDVSEWAQGKKSEFEEKNQVEKDKLATQKRFFNRAVEEQTSGKLCQANFLMAIDQKPTSAGAPFSQAVRERKRDIMQIQLGGSMIYKNLPRAKLASGLAPSEARENARKLLATKFFPIIQQIRKLRADEDQATVRWWTQTPEAEVAEYGRTHPCEPDPDARTRFKCPAPDSVVGVLKQKQRALREILGNPKNEELDDFLNYYYAKPSLTLQAFLSEATPAANAHSFQKVVDSFKKETLDFLEDVADKRGSYSESYKQELMKTSSVQALLFPTPNSDAKLAKDGKEFAEIACRMEMRHGVGQEVTSQAIDLTVGILTSVAAPVIGAYLKGATAAIDVAKLEHAAILEKVAQGAAEAELGNAAAGTLYAMGSGEAGLTTSQRLAEVLQNLKTASSLTNVDALATAMSTWVNRCMLLSVSINEQSVCHEVEVSGKLPKFPDLSTKTVHTRGECLANLAVVGASLLAGKAHIAELKNTARQAQAVAKLDELMTRSMDDIIAGSRSLAAASESKVASNAVLSPSWDAKKEIDMGNVAKKFREIENKDLGALETQRQELAVLASAGRLNGPEHQGQRELLEALSLRTFSARQAEQIVSPVMLDRELKKLAARFIKNSREITGEEVDEAVKDIRDLRTQLVKFKADNPNRPGVAQKRAEFLIEALSHPFADIRKEARRALLAIGVPFEYTPDVVRQINYELLEEIPRYKMIREVDVYSALLKDPLIAEIRRMPESAVAEVLRHASSGVGDSHILEMISVEALREGRSVEFLTGYLNNSSTLVRQAAVAGLDGRFTAEARAALETALHDKDLSVRIVAGYCLRDFPDSASKLLAREQLVRDGIELRSLTDEVIGDTLTDDAFAYALQHGHDRRKIIFAKNLQDRPAKIIQIALTDPDPEIRIAAMKSISGRKDPDSLKLIEKAMDDPVQEVRAEAVARLVERDSLKADQLIERALHDPSPEVRFAAKHYSSKAENAQIFRAEAKNLTTLESQRGPVEAARRLSMGGAARRMEDDERAIQFMENIYHLPESETIPKTLNGKLLTEEQRGKIYAEKLDAWLAKHPGFRLEKVPSPTGRGTQPAIFQDAKGFKAALLRPTTMMGGHPYYLEIGGTQSISDLFADLSLGTNQVGKAYMKARDEVVRHLMEGHDVVITGHSLGSGLAEAMNHDVTQELERRLLLNPNMRGKVGSLRSVGANGFGAKGLLEKKGNFDPKIWKSMDAITYSHKPSFEPVIHAGVHPEGSVYKIKSVAANFPVFDDHRMVSVLKSMHEGGLGTETQYNPFYQPGRLTIRALSTIAPKLETMSRSMWQKMLGTTAYDQLILLWEAKFAWLRSGGFQHLEAPDFFGGQINDILASLPEGTRESATMQRVDEVYRTQYQIATHQFQDPNFRFAGRAPAQSGARTPTLIGRPVPETKLEQFFSYLFPAQSFSQQAGPKKGTSSGRKNQE